MKASKKQSSRATAKDPNRYPTGWDGERVKAVIEHYDKQSDDEAAAEDEAAYQSTTITMIAVPVELVPKVQKLIGKRAS